MTSTNAGHPPAVITGTRLRRLEAGGPPAGLLPGVTYDQEVVHLEDGDRVVFVTDGVSECLLGDLDSAVADLDRRGTAPALCASVFQLSDDRTAAAPVENWDDDRTVVVLAYETLPKTGT
jgi:serine phosphatase RsbU (regulator of sigma subunit)